MKKGETSERGKLLEGQEGRDPRERNKVQEGILIIVASSDSDDP